MKVRCERCHERPSVSGALKWYGALFLGGWFVRGSYCADCAGGMNFVGLVAVSVIAVIAFVLAIIVW